MPDIRDLPVMSMADAQSIGFAGFNDVPHLAVDVPDGAFTITTRTSDGRRTTFSFQPYDADGAARFCDIQFHDRGSTIPDANGGQSPTFNMFGITRGGRHIVDTRALTEDIKPSILVLLLDRQTEERPVAVPRLRSTMGNRDLANLLNRAAAVIEDPNSEIRSHRDDLTRQLTGEAAKRRPDLQARTRGGREAGTGRPWWSRRHIGNRPMRSILAFYEMNRNYGGPEEGGWWFDSGTFVRAIGIYFDDASAIRAMQRANRLLDRLQRHKPRIDSAIYAGGRHRAYSFTGLPPESFPAKRPRYE